MDYEFHKLSCYEPGVILVCNRVCGASQFLLDALNGYFIDGYVLSLYAYD